MRISTSQNISTGRPANRRGVRRIAAMVTAASLVGGCSTIVLGTLTVADFSNVAGVVATIATGKGLQEHMISMVMGKDCRILDGMMRSDRKICEDHGAVGTDKDFKGVIAMITGEEPEQTPARLYAKNVDRKRLKELGGDVATSPSLAQPRRRSAGAISLATQERDKRLSEILAAAATVAESQSLTRLAQHAPATATATVKLDRQPISASFQSAELLNSDVVGSDRGDLRGVGDERPSLSRTERRRALPRRGQGSDFADGPQARDSLDRLSAAVEQDAMTATQIAGGTIMVTAPSLQ